MIPPHLPTDADLDRWPQFTAAQPLSLLVSGCITGIRCGSDATAYGAPYPHTKRLLQLPNVRSVAFCPEDFAFGTPREIPDIHGGDGFDVLDGHARVFSTSGDDWTASMIEAANAMLGLAQREHVQLALLMDISAACGSQVCAALLIRNGIPVLSQRDHRILGRVVQKLDASSYPTLARWITTSPSGISRT
jgi:uncharacterized protein YbbK (DUF523 family)